MVEPDQAPSMLQVENLKRKIEQQKNIIKKYKHLAKVVHEAETWEFGIYDEFPDDNWIALSQKSYEEIMHALSELDELQPWKSTIEKRLGRR